MSDIEIIVGSDTDVVVGGVAQSGPPGADGAGATNNILYGTGDPTSGTGSNGNFYINTTSWTIFGPKAGGAWPAGASIVGPPGAEGSPGTAGRTLLNGAGVPDNGTGSNGDFYFDTTGSSIYGPKSAGVWGAGTSLVGPEGSPGNDGAPGASGADGADGVDGSSILNGSGAPGGGTGANGDFYLDTGSWTIYGPKTAGAWGSGVALQGADGSPGTDGSPGADGADGRTILNGTTAPAGGTGANGDFYINTATSELYGPKTAGAWGSGVALQGADGAPGSDGADGRTILNGSGAPGGGTGSDGDFYLDTASWNLYGPKTGGAWGSGVALQGADGAPGAAGADGADGAPGADGRTILNGTTAPDSGTGANGDFYLDTAAWEIYGPKTGGAWGSGTPLIGQGGAGDMKVTSTTVPTPVADTVQFFRETRAGKSHAAAIGPDGDRSVMGSPSLNRGFTRTWRAHSNGNSPAVVGFGNSTTGTPTGQTMVTTSGWYGQTPKVRYTTAASNNAAAGTRHGVSEFWSGDAAGLGGYLYGARIALAANAADAGTRMYVGMHGVNSVIAGGTDPTSLTNFIALVKDADHTTLRLAHNDGSGAATEIDLGANFPADTNVTDVYELWLYAEPNSTSVNYEVRRINGTTGVVSHTASGTVSTDLPASSVRLSPQIWISTGNPGVAAALDVFAQYMETEY